MKFKNEINKILGEAKEYMKNPPQAEIEKW